MTNNLTNHDRIAKLIQDAVVRGSGYAAAEAASTIDKEFVLIKKSDLPKVVFNEFYGTHKARTASYNRKTSAAVYMDRALDFIAISQFAEKEADTQAKIQLRGKRDDAYKMLFPNSAPLWAFEDLSDNIKAQIDVVVGLMTQVDTLKETK